MLELTCTDDPSIQIIPEDQDVKFIPTLNKEVPAADPVEEAKVTEPLEPLSNDAKPELTAEPEPGPEPELEDDVPQLWQSAHTTWPVTCLKPTM